MSKILYWEDIEPTFTKLHAILSQYKKNGPAKVFIKEDGSIDTQKLWTFSGQVLSGYTPKNTKEILQDLGLEVKRKRF